MSQRLVRRVHVGPVRARETLARLQDLDRRMRRWKADYEEWRHWFDQRFGATPLYEEYVRLRPEVRHVSDAMRQITKAYRQHSLTWPAKPGVGDVE